MDDRYLGEEEEGRQRAGGHKLRPKISAAIGMRRDGRVRSHAMLLQLVSTPLGWLRDKAAAKAQDALIAVLAAGPIPQHIAFILDGNRRYARSKNMQIKEGHTDGFYTLRKVCRLHRYVAFRPLANHCIDARSMHKAERSLRERVCVLDREFQAVPRRGGGTHGPRGGEAARVLRTRVRLAAEYIPHFAHTCAGASWTSMASSW